MFAGLEGFGFKNLDVDIYEKKEETEDKKENKEPTVVKEEEFIFDKTFECPVCDHEFKSKMIRTGRIKLASADTDLRPRYQQIDSLKYDAVMCPHCGYAALNRYFDKVMNAQRKLIRDNISTNFHPVADDSLIYSYDTAITRHKMALLCTVVKKGKESEKAYDCLKIAWLLRGKSEEMLNSAQTNKKDIENVKKEEQEFLLSALKGFTEAFSKEDFPMCGMDQHTLTYLIAELARRVGQYDLAKRWVSKVLTARDANSRIKDKAYDLKDVLTNH